MKVKNIFLSLIAVIVFLAACKKTDVQAPTRLFRPVISGSLSTINTSIIATWSDIKSAVNYQVQLSRDTFKTIDITMSVDTNTVQANNLKPGTIYQVQVRAIAADTTLNSRWSNLGSIKVPTILTAPTISDITDEAIRVVWVNNGPTVTNIKLLRLDSSLVRNIPLTSTDVTNQFKIITGLASNTTYIVMIYSNSLLLGFGNYTTKAALTGTVIDLRNITDRPSVLADTLPLVDAGATILLRRGVTYNIATTVNLSKSVTIQSGADLLVTDPAIIYFTSNFNFVAGSAIDYIDFKDLVLRGSDYTAKYVVNSTANATIGRISFESCKAEFFRGLVRLQSGTVSVTDFNIKNSVIDSIKDYAVLTVGAATIKVNNISIDSSTFYKLEKFISSAVAGSTSNSVTIKNCTFNEVPLGGGANYLIDYNTNNVLGGIIIKNCILGAAKGGGASMLVRGARYATTGLADGSGSYNTSDYLVSVNPISNLTPYAKLSTDIFTDPYNGNFKIKDNAFPGKSTTGDPRWR